MFLMLVTNFVT